MNNKKIWKKIRKNFKKKNRKIWRRFKKSIVADYDWFKSDRRVVCDIFKNNVIINSLLFAMIASVTYFTFIINMDIELFTEYDDHAFNFINHLESDSTYQSGQKILVLEIDDAFLKKNGLMDDSNLLNKEYNDFFPRKHLINLINKLDMAKPKLLFINLDLSKSKEPSVDKKLIKLLGNERPYTIYFTHNVNESFIEDAQIEDIHFVSTMLIAYHNKVRHYQPFKKIDKTYTFGPLIFSGKDISKIDKECNVVNNRFIYKDRFEEGYSEKSYWEDITFVSLDSISNLSTEFIKDAIVFLGSTHSNNHDVHTIYDGSKKPGVEILANTLASINYFSPQLKLSPTVFSMLIVFSITFFVRYAILSINRKSPVPLFYFLVVVIVVNFLVSYFLLFKVFHLWLNFLTPYTLYIFKEASYQTGSVLRFFYHSFYDSIVKP